MANSGDVAFFSLLVVLAFGTLWKPGVAITALGGVLFLVGALPMIGLVYLVGRNPLIAVGVVTWPFAVAGIFIMAFGRLVSSVEAILAEMREAQGRGGGDGRRIELVRREPTIGEMNGRDRAEPSF